jgi:hypothetical protein
MFRNSRFSWVLPDSDKDVTLTEAALAVAVDEEVLDKADRTRRSDNSDDTVDSCILSLLLLLLLLPLPTVSSSKQQ